MLTRHTMIHASASCAGAVIAYEVGRHHYFVCHPFGFPWLA